VVVSSSAQVEGAVSRRLEERDEGVDLEVFPGETIGGWSKFFLVALRLVIGWHFLVEGLDKLQSPTWSSEAYLREASGPLAPRFRDLAGDRLVDMLTVGPDNSFPAELDVEWETYFDAFADFYQLDDQQRARARDVLRQKLDKLR
jgi:hypothetical protein